MSIRVIADSSANLLTWPGADFVPVPMEITADRQRFVDDDQLDMNTFLSFFRHYNAESSTACPAPGDWMKAIGESEESIIITLTGTLSGTYQSALMAAGFYHEDHPNRKVFVLDSASTGPHLELLVEKAIELSNAGVDFARVTQELTAYQKATHLSFSLASLDNFAANGRVNKALAHVVKVMRIHIVGEAHEGELKPINKCRGEKAGMEQLWQNIQKAGYRGGRMRIRHTDNLPLAEKFFEIVKLAYPDADVTIGANRGLCSYYAESGSLLVGFEKDIPHRKFLKLKKEK